jgi:hypothetical protein
MYNKRCHHPTGRVSQGFTENLDFDSMQKLTQSTATKVLDWEIN